MKNMNTLVIGDLHGKYEIAKEAINSGYNCIFVGDYLDSFDQDVNSQINTLQLILDSIEKDPEKYQGLLGNHELSYLDPTMVASGYRSATAAHVLHLKERMLKLLKSFTTSHGFLISHAGISNALLVEEGISLNEYLDNGNYKQIGYARGGSSPIGGLYWCDWFQEFEPIPDQPQIVGHSGYRSLGEYEGILEKDGSYNVDCYDHKKEFLLLEDYLSVKIIKELSNEI